MRKIFGWTLLALAALAAYLSIWQGLVGGIVQFAAGVSAHPADKSDILFGLVRIVLLFGLGIQIAGGLAAGAGGVLGWPWLKRAGTWLFNQLVGWVSSGNSRSAQSTMTGSRRRTRV